MIQEQKIERAGLGFVNFKEDLRYEQMIEGFGGGEVAEASAYEIYNFFDVTGIWEDWQVEIDKKRLKIVARDRHGSSLELGFSRRSRRMELKEGNVVFAFRKPLHHCMMSKDMLLFVSESREEIDIHVERGKYRICLNF